jgi:four helix bundle protein
MATIERFEDIISWAEARKLNRMVDVFVKENRFGHDFDLRKQIVRSAGSIMDNIAEGFERGGNKEFVQFLFIARGSCGELRSQFYRALDKGMVVESEFKEISIQLRNISSLILRLINYLKKSEITGLKFKGR